MYHIIINPASRSGKGKKMWREFIEPALKERNISYIPYFSEHPGHVAELAAQIAAIASDKPVSLIVLGGDGTINEALSGIKDTSKVILGYIPTGSSNDLARDLKIPTAPAAALNLILDTKEAAPMDLGTVTFENGESRRFAVSCGFGYDAAICEEANRSKLKNILNRIGLGKLIYLGVALKQLASTKATKGLIALDDQAPIQIGDILFVATMIHRYEGGGFMFCPDAIDHDGILNLCTVGDISKGLVLRALPTAFNGEHYRFDGITAYQGKRVCLEASSPLWVHTDGEVSRQAKKIVITCEQNAIRMIRP